MTHRVVAEIKPDHHHEADADEIIRAMIQQIRDELGQIVENVSHGRAARETERRLAVKMKKLFSF